MLEPGGTSPDVILLAAGSEVALIVSAAAELKKQGVNVRVVSMPSMRLFDEQADEYKSSVLLERVPVLAVEAGSPQCWWKYAGRHGAVIGLERFGASAPAAIVMEKLGISLSNVVAHAQTLVAQSGKLTAGGKK